MMYFNIYDVPQWVYIVFAIINYVAIITLKVFSCWLSRSSIRLETELKLAFGSPMQLSLIKLIDYIVEVFRMPLLKFE